MPTKKSKSNCSINAKCFADKIKLDENQTVHANHRVHGYRPELIDKSRVSMDVLSSKFGLKGFFNKDFWNRILNNMFGKLDQNVMQSSEVGVVPKDKKKASTAEGWRLIWKTKPVLKFYDRIRAECICLDAIENTAYKAKSSTNTALSKLSCMHFNMNQGLMGADFQNAFALACRPCINQVCGCEFLPKCLYFDVKINNSSSINHCSYTGTGAGRPTGGPCFNVALDTLFYEEDVNLNEVAVYADDSQIRCDYNFQNVNNLLNVFKNGYNFGLKVHLTGKKSPTFLPRKGYSLIDLPKEVRIVQSTAFLGLECCISEDGYFIAQCTKKVLQRLHFLLYSLGSGLKLAYYGCSSKEQNMTFKSASQSISAMVESRI
jgi:hypothetical protein